MKKVEMNTMRIKLMREILDAKVRFIAITFVVVIGVMIFIGSSMSYRNLKTSYLYTYQKLNFADFRVKSERIPQYLVNRSAEVPGITMATPRVKEDASFTLSNGKRLVGRVTGIPTKRPIVDDLLIEEGRFFKSGDSMVCIAESHFAEFYKLHPGDTVFYIKNGVEIPVKVIGVAASPEYLVLAGEKGDFSSILSVTSMAILYMPVSDVQQMADLPNKYNQVLYKVRDPKNMEPQIAAVEEIMKDTGIQEILTQEEHQGNQMLEMDLEGFKSFALFFPLLFLGIACFSIYILLSRLVYTQRPFIGVMRAMGYSRRQILMHYLSFALAIGILGAIVGAVGGYGLSYIVAGIYAGTIGIPMVRVDVYWQVILQGMALSVIFCAVAGIIPALSSALQDPSKAMRGETLQQVFKMPLAERLFPPLSRIPMFLKVPLRNMFRNKRRTAFTIIGLMFSVMVVLIFLAILNTAGEALNRGFNTNNRFDMVAVFMGGRDAALINKIERIPGVGSVESTVSDQVKFSWNGSSMDTVMMGIEPDSVMRHFYTPGGTEVKIANRHVLLNQWFHTQKGVDVGDTVTLKTNYREKTFIVSPFIEEPLGNIAYIDRAEARELMDYGQASRGSFYVKALPNHYLEVKNSLEQIDGLATVIDLRQIKSEVKGYMNLLYMIVYVMLIFALIMAFTLTFNTITINILEREKEIATIRTIGTQSWKISAMSTLENVIYGLLAVIPGCILGVVVGKYAMGLQSSEYMTLALVVYPSSYLLVAFGIIAILLICQVPSLQYVKRVELAEATKERGG
jgi:putative ABC transport system permease protein